MQWIKVFTNIFANPKMQLLLKKRDGDTFFRIWIQLLVIAGISMQGGKTMMSKNTPMTVEDLATITHKSNKKIQNILDKLIHFEMLICEDNICKIKNWDKYQSADKYEIVKEQNRENQKNENNVNVTEENIKENNKYITKRLDSKSDIKRKYKLIIEEEYIYESDSPEDIDRIIDSYVNYT